MKNKGTIVNSEIAKRVVVKGRQPSIHNLQLSILLFLVICLMPFAPKAQVAVPIPVRELASDFGIRPQFLDDTVHIARYLDSLQGSSHALADSCVTLNSKLMAMNNVLLYDYRHNADTVWIDATHYIEDYALFSSRIEGLSAFILGRAHGYLDRERQQQQMQQLTALNLRRDTIDRNHRSILNACEGIGVTDKERKKELKDIYYSYLSVYNRYDFSMKRNDAEYLGSLDRFSRFQQHLLDSILGTNNYTARINNFSNTLKVRCGHDHSEVFRSYQRAFRHTATPVTFSTIRDYYAYTDSLQQIINIQNGYLSAVELREQINANSKRIVAQYGARFRDVAKTYQEVAASINTVPAFNSIPTAQSFLANLHEFTQVQDAYLNDYLRLAAIQRHADTIRRTRYSDVAKAYKALSDANPMLPTYRTLHDATRFSYEMDRFEYLQRQYDTIISSLQFIDYLRDSVSRGWMQHLTIYNGLQSVTKQFVFVPTFIDAHGGSQFIEQLRDFSDVEQRCLYAIRLGNEMKELNTQIEPEVARFRHIRKAYSQLEKDYLVTKSIQHLTDLYAYCRQYEAFISVQKRILEIVKGTTAPDIDIQLKQNKDPQKVESILGL